MLPAPQGSSAASSSGEAALTLLSLPGDVLALVASKLVQLRDRLRLEASCHTLLAASRGEHGGVYWGGTRLIFEEYSEEGARQLGRFLVARRPTAAALQLEPFDHELAIGAPTLPTLPGLQELQLWQLFIDRPAWDAALRQTQLTSLLLLRCHFAQGAVHWVASRLLRVLPALQEFAVSAELDDEGQASVPLACLQLAGCTHLTSLTLQRCGLTELPAGLSALSALQSCSLGGNNLSRAQQWADLASLRQLTELQLNNCALTTIPVMLSCLTGLQHLSLPANFDLQHGWQQLAPLTGLTHLDLSFNHFERLPSVLSQLTGLRRLDISNCMSLTASDEAWRPLEGHLCLRVLDAHLCIGMAAVPAALATLRRLENLDLSFDFRLAEGGGWHHLAGLTGLTRLGLKHCGLQAVPPELTAFAQAGIVNI